MIIPSCTAEGLLDSYVRLVISIRTSSGFESRDSRERTLKPTPDHVCHLVYRRARLSTRCVAVDDIAP